MRKNKSDVLAFCLFVLFAYPLLAAISDPAALKKARDTWGSQAMIGTGRDVGQSNWTKLVGFKSGGCQQSFTAVGTGFNTWDAAYADADAKPYAIAGPFAGVIHLSATAYDNVAVAGVKFYIDSNPYQQVIPSAPAQSFTAVFDIDTNMLPNGIHVACAQAWDPENNLGRSPRAYLFQISQTSGVANATLVVGQMVDGNPSMTDVLIVR
jgi:hypothetical protein